MAFGRRRKIAGVAPSAYTVEIRYAQQALRAAFTVGNCFNTRCMAMQHRRVWIIRGLLACAFASTLLLAACGKDDPQARLQAAVAQLQEALEAKDARAAMELVDERFRMQGDLDQRQARQTMLVVFQRYANIRIFAVGNNTRLDPDSPLTGYTDAQVLVTGAQGFIPERAEPYAVRMEWRQVDGNWKVYDLKWQ